MKKTLKGFTLIEMLIVIVIIGILAAVLIPKIGGARERAEDVAVKANVRTISTYLMTKSMDNALPDEGTDNAISDTMWNESDMPTVASDDRGDYTYAKSSKKFVICGKLEGADGNSASGASADLVTATLGDSGEYYCIQG